jgi:hypothetical protein
MATLETDVGMSFEEPDMLPIDYEESNNNENTEVADSPVEEQESLRESHVEGENDVLPAQDNSLKFKIKLVNKRPREYGKNNKHCDILRKVVRRNPSMTLVEAAKVLELSSLTMDNRLPEDFPSADLIKKVYLDEVSRINDGYEVEEQHTVRIY